MNNVECKDNLDFMKDISDSLIDLIYCDVLFNTGNKFDSYSDNIDSPELFYIQRLIEMKRLLKDTGLCYIHCDYNLSHYMKIWMDQIFGKENFRNEIILDAILIQKQ